MCAALALVQYGLTSMVLIVVMFELVSKSLGREEGKGGEWVEEGYGM
jgi:hypothetical protein